MTNKITVILTLLVLPVILMHKFEIIDSMDEADFKWESIKDKDQGGSPGHKGQKQDSLGEAVQGEDGQNKLGEQINEEQQTILQKK